jgi:hypothetical protein
MKHYLGLCAIARDETPYLEEWVRYYALQGVEHIILFDNESRTPIRQTLRDWLCAGFVTIIEIGGQCRQLPCYQVALNEFGRDFYWLAFVDLDEFIVVKKAFTLADFLLGYEPFGGVGLNWAMFGTSGLEGPTADLVTEKFTWRLPDANPVHLHIKSIIQPKHVAAVGHNPHSFRFNEGSGCVNERMFPIPDQSPFTFFSNELAQINHYFTKSRQEYLGKIGRGRADTGQRHQVVEPFRGEVEDHSIAPHIRRLKATLDLSPAQFLKDQRPVPDGDGTPKELLLEIAGLFSSNNTRDIAPRLARLSLTAPPEVATPVKLQYLIERGRYDEATALAKDFLKKLYSYEVGAQYVRLLRRQGLAAEADNFSALLNHLKQLYKI